MNENQEKNKQDTPVTEKAEKTKKEGKASFKKFFASTKFKHGGASLIMSVIFIAIVVVINIAASALSGRFPSLDIDMTANKLNSLSEDALAAAKAVQNDTEIILLINEDEADSVLNMGDLKYTQVVTLAKKMQEANSKIKVSFIDLDANPQFAQDYAEYNLAKGSVVVKSAKRVKVLAPTTDLFTATQNSSTYEYEYSSKVDGALANAVSVVNVDKVPLVAVATGHDEKLPADGRAAFDKNLSDHGIEIKEFNILTDVVPAEASVVLIPTPSTDYTAAEVQKLRDFLSDKTATEARSIFYITHYTQTNMPVLETFLADWGIQVGKSMIAETDSNHVLPGGDASSIFVQSTNDLFKANSYSYLCAPYGSPITLLFSGNDSITTSSLWSSYDTAYAYTDAENNDPSKTAQQIVGAMASRTTQKDSGYVNENVVVFSSAYAFIDSFVDSSTFGNKQYFTDLFANLTGADVSQVYVAPVSVNTRDISASSSMVNVLGLGVFTIALPLLIVALGLVIFLRRRHL